MPVAPVNTTHEMPSVAYYAPPAAYYAPAPTVAYYAPPAAYTTYYYWLIARCRLWLLCAAWLERVC